MNQERQHAVPAVPERKQYVSPVLIEYGSVSKLTQNGAGSFSDGAAFMGGACL